MILFFFILQTESQNYLIEIQPNFKGGLIESVEVFVSNVFDFASDYREVRW